MDAAMPQAFAGCGMMGAWTPDLTLPWCNSRAMPKP